MFCSVLFRLKFFLIFFIYIAINAQQAPLLVESTNPSATGNHIVDFDLTGNLVINFNKNLNTGNISSSVFKLTLLDGSNLDYTLNYYNESLPFNKARVVITPLSNLAPGTIYLLEISDQLRANDGSAFDGNNDGNPGGSYYLVIQSLITDGVIASIESKLNEIAGSFTDDTRITNSKYDFWDYAKSIRNDLLSQKELLKNQIISEGINSPAITNDVPDGNLDYKIGSNIYHIKNYSFKNNSNQTITYKLVLDQNGNVISDVETIFKVLLTYQSRNDRYDRENIETHISALNDINNRLLISEGLVIVRDAAVNAAISPMFGRNSLVGFFEGIVNQFADQDKILFALLNSYLHHFDNSLKADYNLALSKASVQSYPRLNYADLSLYLYSQHILFEEFNNFAILLGNIDESRGDLKAQIIDVVKNSINSMINYSVSNGIYISETAKIIFDLIEGGLTINDWFNQVDILNNYNEQILTLKESLKTKWINTSPIVASLLASELNSGQYGFIKILSPNGGEKLYAGSSFAISWSSVNVSNVKIEYSINGGSSWISPPIANSISSSSGILNWTVPQIESANCKIRIISTANSQIFDLSDQVFSISSSAISLSLNNIDFGQQLVNTESQVKSYTLNAENLSSDLTLTSTSGFWIKTSLSDSWKSTLTLAQVNGKINSTVVFVQFQPYEVRNFNGAIKHSVSNSPDVDLLLTGIGAPPPVPFITVSTNSLIDFGEVDLGSSRVMSFKVSAGNLITNVTVNNSNAPGFLISDSFNGPFSDKAIIRRNEADNSVNSADVFVKISPDVEKKYQGYLVVRSTDVNPIRIDVSATGVIHYIVSTAYIGDQGFTFGSGSFINGSNVSVLALPECGFMFTGWSVNGPLNGGGQLVSSDQLYTFKIGSNLQLFANFTWGNSSPDYNITVSANQSTGGSVTGGGNFNSCDLIAVTATPNSGYYFAGWNQSGINVSSSPNYSFHVTSDRSLVANFLPIPPGYCSVEVVSDPEIGANTFGSGLYKQNSRAWINADINDGYSFVNWSEYGNLISSSQGFYFIIDRNRKFTINLDLKKYNITVAASPSNGGIVSGAGEYSHGEKLNLAAFPSQDFKFHHWNINSGQNSYYWGSRYNQKANSNISAEAIFSKSHSIQLISPNSGDYIEPGKPYTIKWKFAALPLVKIDFSSDNGNTWNNITQQTPSWNSTTDFIGTFEWLVPNLTSNTCKIRIAAQDVFEEDYPIHSLCEILPGTFSIGVAPVLFTLNTMSSPEGAGDIIGYGDYSSGTHVTLSATPVRGYIFKNWTENGVILSSSSSFSLALDRNRTIIANFDESPVKYTINVSATPPDLGQVSGGGVFSEWKNIEVTAVPNPGYKFLFWRNKINNNYAFGSYNSKYTFPVDDNKELIAQFGFGVNSISSPVKDSFLKSGLIHTIKWSGLAFCNSVNIDYSSDDGLTWINIVKNYPAYVPNTDYQGSYEWTVPSINSTKCKVRVVSTQISEEDYPIHAFHLLLNGNFAIGENYPPPKVSLILKSNSASFGSTNGAGTYDSGSSVTITALPNEGYVFINWTEYGNIVSENSSFTFIANGDRNLTANFEKISITLITPNGGETWETNTIQKIKWTSIGVSLVNLDYSNTPHSASPVWYPIASNVDAKLGEYEWTIPNTPAPNYHVRISQVPSGIPSSMSSEDFQIFNTKFTYLFPGGGEVLQGDSDLEIKWDYYGPSQNVYIAFGDLNTNTQGLIVGPIPTSTKKILWKVPAINSNNFRIQIFDLHNQAHRISDPISVVYPPQQSLSLLSPSASSEFNSGEILNINWSSDNIDLIRIEYSTDGGISWNLITDNITGAQGSYLWTIPQTNSSNCKIRLSDASDSNPFTISPAFSLSSLLNISLQSSPADCGTLSGSGKFSPGSTVTINAAPLSGFVFANWTENGVVISNNSSFSFQIDKDRNIVANFTQANNKFTVDPLYVDVSIGSGTAVATFNINVESNLIVNWRSIIVQGSEWCTITKGSSGKNTAQLKVKYQKDTDLPRTAIVRIFVDGEPDIFSEVEIRQKIPPSKYLLNVNNENPEKNSPVTITAQLVDKNNNPYPQNGKILNWSSTQGGAFLNQTTITDENGFSSNIFTVSTVSGTKHSINVTDNSIPKTLIGKSPFITVAQGIPAKYNLTAANYNPLKSKTVKITAVLSTVDNDPIKIKNKVLTWSCDNGGVFNNLTTITNNNGLSTNILKVSGIPNTVHRVTVTDNSSPALVGQCPEITVNAILKVEMEDYSSESESVDFQDDYNSIPSDFNLDQNYPNPFNPVTSIRYALPFESKIKIMIINILGEFIITLVDELKPAGTYTVNWDARNFPSGVYFYRIEALLSDGSKPFTQVRKMILMK